MENDLNTGSFGHENHAGSTVTTEDVKTNKILGYILIGLTFLLPLVFTSTLFVDISSLKAFLFLIATYILLFVWFVTRLKKDTFAIPFNLISASALSVALVSVASAVFSNNFSVSFWGRDFGFDSSVYLISLFVFLFISSFILKDVKNASYTYLAFIASAILVTVFHLLLILFPNMVPDLGYFFSNTTNTVGKWFDLGVFFGLMTILSLVSIGLLKVKSKLKIALQVILGVSLFMLLIIGFVNLWVVIGIFALMVFVYLMLSRLTSGNKDNSIPVSALIVIILSATILLSGLGSASPINSKIQGWLSINFTDIRPSVSTTYEVAKDALIESPIIGKDFSSFDKAWVMYKPNSINLTEFWNTDFRYGYGLLPTFFATTGILGILSWLAFLGIFTYLGFSSIFKEHKDEISKYILVSSFVSSLYLWVMMFIYIPSHVTLFLTFLFSSIFIGSLYRERHIAVKEFSISKNPKYGFIYIFLVVIFLIVSITMSYNLTEKFVAHVYARQSLVALQQGNLELAQSKIVSALNFEQNDIFFRDLSNIQQIMSLQVQNNTDLTETEQASLFENYISNSIQSASAAVEFDPQSYSNFYYLGDLFANLISLKIEGIAAKAIEFMEQAKVLNPSNPEIPLALARVYMSQEDLGKAKELIDESIRIKSNYTDAVYLLSQINVAEGDIDKAIENVRVTTLVRPNDPVTYFQLGLLQYQNKDFTDAVNSFEIALTKNIYYANAKYFLGLSYYEIKKVQEAIRQFDELSKLNPDNLEVSLILSNLKAGLAPFAGASNEIPPIDDEPENRNEPPLNDDNTEAISEEVSE